MDPVLAALVGAIVGSHMIRRRMTRRRLEAQEQLSEYILATKMQAEGFDLVVLHNINERGQRLRDNAENN